MPSGEHDRYRARKYDEDAFNRKVEDVFGKDANARAFIDSLIYRHCRDKAHFKSRVKRLTKDRAAAELGIMEIKHNRGGGIRVYCAVRNDMVIILDVGNKRTQDRDIRHATRRLSEFDARESA